MKVRRTSKPIRIGSVVVGGDAPVVVQSMTKTDTRDVPATVQQIRDMELSGCELARVAVPDMEAVEALKAIKGLTGIPLIADIHFDYRLALGALAAGVDGLRLNPGNIGDPEKVAAVARSAKERSVPIRIGVNAGSLPRQALENLPQKDVASIMVDVAMEQVRLLESMDFDLIKVSLKAFDVPTTVEAYRLIAGKIVYPLHLGITESGPPRSGIVRSSVGLGVLLYQGIGDTIRVSLTAPPVEEVDAAYEILKSLNLRERGPVLVSCPSCGRVEVDIMGLVRAVEDKLNRIPRPVKVAVMGCVVNGPGEARDADVGLAGGKGRGVLFRKGEPVRTVDEKDFLPALMDEIDKVTEDSSGTLPRAGQKIEDSM
ncbi:MAG: flavodoxin-dependent (E)-4-hydroxy-3-methylbut-2-enyl-diphosphate synthase [Chloroflexi bacterium]|nr:flavodoxin-dependent (E)-4-hydroxy-3-methylbut-2-enyl-diphosphate synthase [Chloroflexota bacterium]